MDPDKATAAPYGTAGDDSRLEDTVTAQTAARGRDGSSSKSLLYITFRHKWSV